MPLQTVIEAMKSASGSLRNSLSARVFVDLRFKAISSCPAFGPSSGRGTPIPVTSCDAIPPGGNYASADKMFHRHLLLGAAFLIPQACLGIKAQPLWPESSSRRLPNPDTSGLVRTADARHQRHAVHIFRVNSGIKTSTQS